MGPNMDTKQLTEYIHDPDKFFKNILKVRTTGMCYKEIPFHVTPKGQLEVAQSQTELSPTELQRISAGPKRINFDTVVLRSSWKKVFSVVNDLASFIFVELFYDDFEEIQCVDPKSLVIPAGKTGYFEITFCSNRISKLQQSILYKINGLHEFNFLITALVEPAILELSVNHLDFIFEEGQLDE